MAAPPLLGLAAPLTGATLGWVVLGQSLSASQLLGFVLALSAIAAGAVLAARHDDVVVLDAGRVVDDGPWHELSARWAHLAG